LPGDEEMPTSVVLAACMVFAKREGQTAGIDWLTAPAEGTAYSGPTHHTVRELGSHRRLWRLRRRAARCYAKKHSAANLPVLYPF